MAENQARRNSYGNIDFTEEVSKQCLKQVEFYFSESNFPYDKFLRTTAEKNDGWVPITTIATFNRMKKFRPVDKVVEVLRTSEILEVSENGENVKRRVPLVWNRNDEKFKEAKLEQNKRTLVVMNFPHDEEAGQAQEKKEGEEEKEDKDLQVEIEEFFRKLAQVNQVRLRRDHKKNFRGTVFVEFKNYDECKKFEDEYSAGSKDDKEGGEILSFKGKRLNILTKKQYDMQREATRSKNFSGSGQRSRSFTGHRKNMPKPSKKKDQDSENSSAIAEE
ncbi:uncharacterized protein GVI51_H07887 [Nakaseomyces glabratus]|uniref:La protein-like protein n=1 Tax=Candida glabrata (strain ATCC 2001 / BCRC 20586 / JCM 3761 / NBRC 0622 / NRRL Y-65 / CBS 138) TaxID=284593 RepID=Q6FRJ9_CANGA|nr:uncharacterized protein CAGL0H07975g [Nakaseomyces glabratus]KAH7586339.1 Eukaryotic RNA Recognition Motif (RRM) profile [Nakaseomyces glabratus]KAH7600956.1 Eukaryotic RNA Recognition Motif (RRM) profile [Nakaseomyces glabratus]KAH7601576.1 Eukaryotic RNA Recognition Motif (RRM) profile [Nakaseomyces glabratus]KAH7605956.1 Eukaryotic RNA Recognition Motif (RRM) profile [Nakaseomyces glabratus]KAH7613395.1 Eukaryotic RNA Recognition Motif (RRM) profile [Nakaseomyces glabratus]|eukprot:XP_447145.1 uncharacterized protein CAGL0H07975g [[Candida] glabrata]